jgi:hypothetical protein
MSSQIFASLLTVLVLGLFIGTNLGVLLMCLMRMASPDPEPEGELAHMAVRLEDGTRRHS